MLIDQVPIFVGFKPATPLREDQYPKAQAALVKALNEQWKGKYRIVAQRFYVFAPYDRRTFPQWVMLQDFVGNYFRDEVKGEKEYWDITPFPGPAATVWKLGDQRFAAAEAGSALPNGGALCGYFQLEKE